MAPGSARLDYYRKGGDSLANRYRHFRLHPFSWREMNAARRDGLESLLRFGGFPEPLVRQDVVEDRIWQRDRTSRVVREDLRDLERVREISLIELLVDLLPVRVGSRCHWQTWRTICRSITKRRSGGSRSLRTCTYAFGYRTMGASRVRAVKKERKLYLWDWSQVKDPGSRFENLVASQLLKNCHFIEDTQGHVMELRSLRDSDCREIDFVVPRKGKPLFAFEYKTGEKDIIPSLFYFVERTSIPSFYQVHLGSKHFEKGNVSLVPFERFCEDLQMP